MQELDGLEWEQPAPASRGGCLTAIGLALVLWGVIIWTGIYLWRNL